MREDVHEQQLEKGWPMVSVPGLALHVLCTLRHHQEQRLDEWAGHDAAVPPARLLEQEGAVPILLDGPGNACGAFRTHG